MALLGQEHGVRGEEKGGEIVETEVKPRDTDDKNHLGSFLLLFCRAILFTFVGGGGGVGKREMAERGAAEDELLFTTVNEEPPRKKSNPTITIS